MPDIPAPLPESSANHFLRRYFYERPLRIRIFLAQLPFSLTMVLAASLIAILQPRLLAEGQLIAALVLSGFLLAASVTIPWDKLRPGSFLIIPYLDFVAVALFREGSDALLSSAGVLAFYPIFWLCASGYAPKTAVIASTVASTLIVWNPVLTAPGTPTGEQLVRPLLFPFMMLAFAIATVVFVASMNRQHESMATQGLQLRAALADSRKRERLMETIVNTVGVGVVVVDSEGNDLLMNSTQQAIHSLAVPADNPDPEEKDLLVFGFDRGLLAPEDRPVRRAVLGESFTNYQVWIGEGEQAIAVSTTARIIQDEDGSSDGAVIAFHDVTEMVNALTAKDDFVANVSHEFRTPLTAIQSYLAMAMEEPELAPKKILSYLQVADRNAERLNALVSDLLTTTNIVVDPTPCDISTLIADSLFSAAPAAAANAVAVESHCPHPLLAVVDAGRMSQVLDNLVSNAVKYSPDGGTLTVRAWADGTDLHCQVQDTGIGMSAAEQTGVFTKFFRAGTAMARNIPGIGLGLMISKTIVANHGGTLTFTSERGTGTTVSFMIPACVTTEEALAPHTLQTTLS